ncbi:MAG TPA: energy transducer TonB [Terriglobales bacterium]|nr:energy transducer TonB [Terriglobales bacterium]
MGDQQKRWVTRKIQAGFGRLLAIIFLAREIKPNLYDRLEVSKVKDGQWRGQRLRCVVTKLDKFPQRNYCFDSAMGVLRTIQRQKEVAEYADYTAVGTKTFPSTLRVWDGNRLTFEAKLEELTFDVPLDRELFAPPPGAIALANCDDIEYPKPLHTPDPSFPIRERNARQSGKTLLYMVVGTDGHTHDITVIDSTTVGFGEAAVEAVATWTFKPATCHGTSVPFEMRTEVNFRLY